MAPRDGTGKTCGAAEGLSCLRLERPWEAAVLYVQWRSPRREWGDPNYRGQEREPHTSSGPYLPSPLAILMSRAVRIRAMSVEVKCTVMSSATGMFINTSLCETQSRRDAGETHPDTVSEDSSAGGDAPPPAAGFQGVPYMGVPSSLQGVRAAGRGGSSGRGPFPTSTLTRDQEAREHPQLHGLRACGLQSCILAPPF